VYIRVKDLFTTTSCYLLMLEVATRNESSTLQRDRMRIFHKLSLFTTNPIPTFLYKCKTYLIYFFVDRVHGKREGTLGWMDGSLNLRKQYSVVILFHEIRD
jgi:hypothetical protein